ncbi:MAG: NAD(P)/FAD-dependent oxidoreductase [Clostridia bacterium]|nr:NAD(P)/FAD-dependent oxidoreductase [Clostridia bacterium]
MVKKIIVAGGGHGGIAAAALLAANGFDVTVYEKNKRDNMGYDWTDIFAPDALERVGLGLPPEDKYEYKKNMTFYGPSANTPLRQDVAEDNLEIKMERSDIYEMLIAHAEKKGVHFEFGCEVYGPIMSGNRVVGIQTENGDFYAPMIIDACGIDSPVRRRLPAACGIEKAPGRFGKFIVYRAFYDKVGKIVDDPYRVYFFPAGRKGIGWVATEEDTTDMLIGCFDELSENDIAEVSAELRAKNPQMGNKILRGDAIVKIPVRQPLAVMIADGYAAIGDSAFMTVPVIGSGIANSLKAARMLADTIIEDEDRVYSCETLWKYQLRYYKALGAGLAPLACVKLLLTKLTPEQLDYLIDNHVLTADDLTIGADATGLGDFLSMSPASLPDRIKGLAKRPDIIKKLLSCGKTLVQVVAHTTALPAHWERRKVFAWAANYCRIFRNYCQQ